MKERFRKISRHIREKQYYYVCGIITIVILAMGFFRFPNAFGRLVESVRDFFVSLAHLFCEMFDIDHNFTVTVNTLPDYNFLNVKKWGYGLFHKTPANTYTPSLPIPETWEEFKSLWVKYWQAWATSRNFFTYLYYTLNVIWTIWIISIFVVPLCWVIKKLFNKYYLREKPLPKKENEEEQPPQKEPEITDSKPLQLWHRFYFAVILRIRLWFVGLLDFIRERDSLYSFWLLCAMLYFNVFTIIVEFFAYYVYLIPTMDFTTLYMQVYKLFLDLCALWDFVSVIGWIVIAYLAVDKFAKYVYWEQVEREARKMEDFLR